MMPFIALGVIVAVVFIQEGQRRIPVQYAKRQVGRKMTQGGSTYLPLRVNMAGVIPIIFAASIMAFPPTIAQLISSPGPRTSQTSSARTAPPTSSASASSSSCSPTSTRRSRSTRVSRRTT